jgi:hypothetical protein
MKQHAYILGRLIETRAHRHVLERYMEMVQERRDLHGVMDASADLRETDARIQTLLWVLEMKE